MGISTVGPVEFVLSGREVDEWKRGLFEEKTAALEAEAEVLGLRGFAAKYSGYGLKLEPGREPDLSDLDKWTRKIAFAFLYG